MAKKLKNKAKKNYLYGNDKHNCRREACENARGLYFPHSLPSLPLWAGFLSVVWFLLTVDC